MNKSKARQELFRRGSIASWYLYDHQKPLYDLLVRTEREIVVPNIARRSGKSTTCVTYCLEEALKKKQDIRYATAFLTDLQNFILPIFNDILQHADPASRPVWKESKKTFFFSNGSTIRLVGLDKNPEGIRGQALDILIVDESAFVKNLEYLYRSVIVPATAARMFKLVFPSTPPQSPSHFWSAELIPKAKERGTYLEFTLDDNNSLSQDEKQRLIDEVGGFDSTTCQREFYCKILIDATRAIAPSFSTANVGVCDDEYINWQYAGDSGGLKDKTCIVKMGYSHKYNKTIIKSELKFEPKTPTPVIATEFQKWSGTDSLVLDAHGQTQVDLAGLGLKVSNPIKSDFHAGLQLINADFYNENILIDPSCEFLITTLTSGLLTANRNDFERTEALGHADAIMALVYSLRAVDKVTDLRPKPKPSEIFTLPPPTDPRLKAFGSF